MRSRRKRSPRRPRGDLHAARPRNPHRDAPFNRIGAVSFGVFGGFSARALKGSIEDTGCQGGLPRMAAGAASILSS